MIQDKIFELSEADNWFLRNKEAIINRQAENDLVFNLINTMPDKNKLKSVIELGSSNGFRLNLLKNILLNCEKYTGVDVSKIAVENGISRYGLDMHQSALDKFKSDEKFDLVIVNFVYHWIDRETIFKAVSNTDSLLNDGGYLIIGDFLPDFPQKRKYHHLPQENIYTYKIDYSEVFKSLNTYKEIHRITYDSSQPKIDEIDAPNSDKRGFCSVLKKDLYGYYPNCNKD